MGEVVLDMAMSLDGFIAGLIDELQIHLVSGLLGEGICLFDNLGTEPIELETTGVIEAPDDATFVSITEAGFSGDGDEIIKQALDSTGGFTWVLAGLKALLEHNIILNLVADRFPEGLENH